MSESSLSRRLSGMALQLMATRTFFSCAVKMYGSGYKLFSGSAFLNSISTFYLAFATFFYQFKYILHFSALPDDIAERIIIFHPWSERVNLLIEFVMLCFSDFKNKLFHIERFADIVKSTVFHGFNCRNQLTPETVTRIKSTSSGFDFSRSSPVRPGICISETTISKLFFWISSFAFVYCYFSSVTM